MSSTVHRYPGRFTASATRADGVEPFWAVDGTLADYPDMAKLVAVCEALIRRLTDERQVPSVGLAGAIEKEAAKEHD